MVSSFARSLHIAPVTILGRRLHPFSAYHALTLEAFASPFFSGGRVPNLADGIEAWLIFQDRYGDERRTMARFARSRAWRWWVRQRLAVEGQGDDVTGWLAARLADYMSRYNFAPTVWTGKDATYTRAPVAWHVVSVLQREGVPFADALNLPYCVALCLKVGIAELNGVRIAEGDLADASEGPRVDAGLSELFSR